MRTLGLFLLIIGIICLIVFGIQAMNDSETFTLFGLDIAVSKANWTPVIISAIVTAVGAFIAIGTKRRN